MADCVPNFVIDQNIFPPIGDDFELIAELPVNIMGDGCNVLVGGSVNWQIQSIVLVDNIVVQFLLAKTPLDNPIEQTLYVFEDGVFDQDIPVMTAFQFLDQSADSTAVYRLYAKVKSAFPTTLDVNMIPVTLFSVGAEAF